MRRRYLVCYDIREPRRLRRTYQTMCAFGEHLQYSVFLCDLSRAEQIEMLDRLRDVVDQRIDSVVIFDLGRLEAQHARRVATLGPTPRLPEQGPRIV